MKLKAVYEETDKLAPFAGSEELCERYGHYDNSGILVDCGEEIVGVLFSLDLSLRAAEEAKKRGANCVVTHHPAIYHPVKALSAECAGGVLACARSGISVISAHLNLDAATGGIDECMMEGLGGKEPVAVMEPLSRGGYGRVYDVEECAFSAFAARARAVFRTERTVAYGDRPVRRVASFCGGGFGEKELAFALEQGADTFVSSDQKHHLVTEAAERGLNVLVLTHYAAEFYGFSRFAERMKARLSVPSALFTDERFL